MLVLLPPSEGKRRGGDGPPVDLADLSWPELTATRARLVKTLVAMCRSDPARARERLGLSEALDEDRAANAELLDSPTMPAGKRYSGTLHDALGYPTLPAAARRRANSWLVVFSGLWGTTRPTDLLPAYRLGIASRLPRLGTIPAMWQAPLRVLDHLIVADGALDLRSTGYTAMYRPSGAARSRLVEVAITGPDGRRAAASYQSKVAKGRLTREMLRAGRPGVGLLLDAAARIGVDATRHDRIDGRGERVVVRLPTGWGLVGSDLQLGP